jgi:hypothetical protein
MSGQYAVYVLVDGRWVFRKSFGWESQAQAYGTAIVRTGTQAEIRIKVKPPLYDRL